MSRGRAIGELAAVFALLLAILWRVGGGAGGTLAGVGVAGIVLLSWRSTGESAASLGLAPSCWRRGWSSALALTAIGVVLLLGAGLALGSASFGAARFAWLGDYAHGILAQQLLLQGFFARDFRALADGRAPARRDAFAIAGATACFVALHAPNPGLMIGVALAGGFWVWHFLRHRNLLAVLASHLVLGTAAMVALGPGPFWDLRVGAAALARMAR